MVWFHGRSSKLVISLERSSGDVRGVERRKGKSSRLGQPFSITVSESGPGETPWCHGFAARVTGEAVRLGSMQGSK